MKHGNTEPNGLNQLMVATAAISVILGIVVGEVIEFDGPSEWHLASITGRGPSQDVLLIILIVLVILSAVWLSATMKSAILIFLGSILLLAGLGGPSAVAHLSPSSKIDTQSRTPFLLLALLEFLGGAFLSAGLLDLLRRRKRRRSLTGGKHNKAGESKE